MTVPGDSGITTAPFELRPQSGTTSLTTSALMASVQHPTASWEAMPDGSSFYRKQEIYTMQWNITNISDYIVAGARYGGPLALIRDPSKIVAYGVNQFTKPTVQVFSSSGELMLTIPWDQGRVVSLGWTFEEQLVILNEEGMYRVYDLQGEYKQHSLGSDAAESGISDAKIHETGMVAMTGTMALLEVKGWVGGKPLVLASSGFSEPPHCWALIHPDQTISRHVEVLLAYDATILSVDNLECIDQRLSRGPFTNIAVSPKGKSIALLTAEGLLWVVSADFQESYAEYNTASEGLGLPRQLVWCGNDALIVTWDPLVLIVGPYGDCLRHYYNTPAFAVNEMDGVKVVDSEKCDIIQRVPTSTEKVFRPGSTSPAAILLDAFDLFEKRSPRSDENIRSIRPDLASAVDDLIEAAGQEIEPYWQRRLLHAAQFGRSFLDMYNPSDFVAMGQTLKVLNAVRYYETGVPITYAQYTYATPQHLINRLTARNFHLLALRISSYLHLKPDSVLKHWAAEKIARSKGSNDTEKGDDAAICRLIVEKFQSAALEGDGVTVSYADIAGKAWENGKGRLATMLLDHEPRAADQVPLLLTMKEDSIALTKAIESGDTDLVYHVLLHLKRKMTLGDFFRLIEDGGPRLAPASKLLQVYAREQDRELLKDYFFQDDRRTESACLALEDAATAATSNDRVEHVKAAAKFFGEDKDRGFEAKMMDEAVRLLMSQQQLEKDMDGKVDFVGLSLNETIRKCLVLSLSKKAERLRSDFKVPEKRFWYTKLYALTEIRDFESLDLLAKSKRSPIGYEPFVSHLVEKGYPKQALAYVTKCDVKQRVDMYLKCGEWRLAGVECKERGDKARLEELRRTCPNNLIARELDQILLSMR